MTAVQCAVKQYWSSFLIILPYATEEVFMLSQILKYDIQISES